MTMTPNKSAAIEQIRLIAKREIIGQPQLKIITPSQLASFLLNPNKAYVGIVRYFSDATNAGITMSFHDEVAIDTDMLIRDAGDYGEFENILFNHIDDFPTEDGEAEIIALEFDLKPWAWSDNLVSNSDLDDDTDWTLGAGWSVADNKATHADGAASNLEQEIADMVEGGLYEVTYTVSDCTAGAVTVEVGGTSGDAQGVDDTYTEYITAGSGDKIKFKADVDFDGSISVVSLKRQIPQT